MSLWAIINAPLILGTDLTRTPQSLLDIVGNREVIAINQDRAGNQGVTVARRGDVQVVVKTLAEPGAKAVALINRGATPVDVSVPVTRFNLSPHSALEVRDVWTGKARQHIGPRLSARLQPYETALLLVKGARASADIYLNEMPARINVAQVDIAPGTIPPPVPAQLDAAPAGDRLHVDGKQYDNGIGIWANSRLEIRLDKSYRRFRAVVGPLAAADPELRFKVYGDGNLLREVHHHGSLDIDVSGVQTLELIATSNSGTSPVAVAWADARLAR